MRNSIILTFVLISTGQHVQAFDFVRCGAFACAGQCTLYLKDFIQQYSDDNEICGGNNANNCQIYERYNGRTSSIGADGQVVEGDEYYLYLGIGIEPNIIGIVTCFELRTTIIPFPLPVINSANSCKVPAHSTIDMDKRSLNETVSLVGIPFDLNHASERFQTGFVYQPRTLGLGGWEPTILHRYDTTQKVLHFGDGGTYPTQAISIPGGNYVTNHSGSELYYFDPSGRHLQTKDSLTGLTLWTFNYDLSGKILSVSDRFNNATTFSYHSAGVTVTSPYGQVSQIAINSAGNLTAITNPKNESYSITSDSQGKILSFKKPNGETSIVNYDTNGFVISDTGAGGDFISLMHNYDNATKIQSVVASTAMGRKTYFQTSANADGSVHVITDPTGQNSNSNTPHQGNRSAFNSLGESSSRNLVQDPRFGWLAPYEQFSSFMIQNSPINISSQTTKTAVLANSNDPLSHISLSTSVKLQNDATRTFTSTYTASNKTIVNTSPLNRVMIQKLNSQGLLESAQLANLTRVTFSYDTRGRLIQSAQGNKQMQLSYDAKGNLASQTDFLGRTTRFAYDNANRVIKQTYPDGSFIQASYDANGNLASITPPGKPKHEFTYNLMEMVSSYLPPALGAQLSGQTNYSYNLDKQLTQIHRPDGNQINVQYDQTKGIMNAMTSLTGSFSLTFKPNTNLVESINSPDGQMIQYSYYGSLVKSVTNNGPVPSVVTYNYNADGSLQSIGQNSLPPIQFTYDKDGLVVGAGSMSMVRNNFGAIQSANLGKVAETTSYDQLGQMSKNQFTTNKKLVLSQEFSRDKMGRIVRVKEQGVAKERPENYEYDKLGRLIKVSGRFMDRSYKYDQNGNRIEKREGWEEIKAKYDDQDRITHYGNIEYQYDANGNRTKKIEYKFHCFHPKWKSKEDKKQITSYEWDAYGNLKRVILPNGKVVQYLIDGQNRRIGKKINNQFKRGYIYQSQTQIMAEMDENRDIIRRFVYGEKINVPEYMIYEGKNYRIVSDQVGTPRAVVNAENGRIEQELDFDEFGIIQDIDGKRMLPFGFAGGLYDSDTGLVHFGARDYDPTIGRWTSKDPIKFQGGDTNLYGYAMNDPINFIDPNGLWSVSVSGYAIFGGGITFGRNPDGSFFGSLRGGVGVGGGVSYDPKGQSSSYGTCSNKDYSIGQYGDIGAHFGPLEGGFGSVSGYGQSRGAYGNYGFYGGLTPSIGVGAGVSGGAEISWH